MIRGYSGYYNGIYLRSSLEFAYAYYLDYKKIIWKYEIATYDLGDEQYKPEFFIFNDKNELIKIVEIKAQTNKIDGINKIKKFKERYNIPIELIEYKDILKIYQLEMPIRYHKAKNIFINDYKAELNNYDMNGNLNPMYGVKHSEKTRKLIGEKCKERFSNKEYKDNFKKSISKITYRKKYTKTPREKRICPTCGKEFIKMITSKQRYCSKQCNKDSWINARNAVVQKYEKHKEQVKNDIFEWSDENKDLILSTKFNKINSTLEGLYKMLYDKYEIKDERSVSNILDTNSRKEFLKILKDYVIQK